MSKDHIECHICITNHFPFVTFAFAEFFHHLLGCCCCFFLIPKSANFIAHNFSSAQLIFIKLLTRRFGRKQPFYVAKCVIELIICCISGLVVHLIRVSQLMLSTFVGRIEKSCFFAHFNSPNKKWKMSIMFGNMRARERERVCKKNKTPTQFEFELLNNFSSLINGKILCTENELSGMISEIWGSSNDNLRKLCEIYMDNSRQKLSSFFFSFSQQQKKRA